MILTIKVITSSLSPYQYGKYGIAMAIIAMFGYILIGPFGVSINRYIIDWSKKGNLKTVLIKYLYLLVIVSTLAGYFVGESSENFYIGFTAGFLYLLSQAVSTTLIPNLNILGFKKQYYNFLNLNIFISLIFAYILVNYYFQEYEYWLFGVSVGNIIASLIAYKYYKIKILKNIKNVSISYKKIFSFSGYIFISSGFTWLYLMGYRFIAEEQIGYESLGIYLAAAAIATGIISAYEQVITGILLPKLYNSLENENSWPEYAKTIFTTSTPVCIFIIFNSEIIAGFVFPEEYKDASIIMQYCAIAEIMRVAVSTIAYYFHGNEKTHHTIMPSILLAIISNIIIYQNISEKGSLIIPTAMIFSSLAVITFYILIIGKKGVIPIIESLPYIIICIIFLSIINLFLTFIELKKYYEIIKLFTISLSSALFFIYAIFKIKK